MTEVHNEVISLSHGTNATSAGPIIEYRASDVSLRYDHQGENGEIEWTFVIFREVLALEVYDNSVCSVADIRHSDEIMSHAQSTWLSQVLEPWRQRVGWQEFQHKAGGEKRFKHYQIYFDDVCCVRVIARSCAISETAHDTH